MVDVDELESIIKLKDISLLSRQENTESTENLSASLADVTIKEEEKETSAHLTTRVLTDVLYELLPESVLFDAESGLLPDRIDIENNSLVGTGRTAAKNFLSIAEIDLKKLVDGDTRHRLEQLRRANKKVSDDFTSFWSQIIGSKSKLSIECRIEHYDSSAGEKAGKEHLTFWIVDGNTPLYPRQRSLGVRWFVSFYLQLRASEKQNAPRIFLLDEPGANLHAKAQADVLKLINKLRNDIHIIYSTHSPQLIEYDKLYRVRAVQRDDQGEDSPTVVIDGLHLGTASTDTLSPILFAMGTDMSTQSVIKKNRNVILEEMSGYFYMRSFFRLSGSKEEVYFIAATGVNKVPNLVNMFLGWGLEFIVAVDDDKQGREVFNQLKKDLYGDDDSVARRYLLKIPGCTCIEEAFSKEDFYRFILKMDEPESLQSNAEYLKSNNISKPVVAYNFWLDVQNGRITSKSLTQATLKNIKAIVESIVKLLNPEK